jgi:hypothetical protein
MFAIVGLSCSAVAQDPQPLQQDHRDWYQVDHYVHMVPKTPAYYHPITFDGRLHWFIRASLGPRSLAAGTLSAAIGTGLDRPPEYGPHWTGFAQRFGMRLTGVVTSNAMEAALGATWGEDPRYFHTVHDQFGDRVKNVLDLTVRAYGRDGERHLAYARWLAIVGSNFLSNTWRAPSQDNWRNSVARSGEGFGARAMSNAFSEFVPPLWRKVRHQRDPFPASLKSP